MTEARQSAVAEVFAGHGHEMLRRASRILKSETDAEDVVQEVMLLLIEAPHVLASVERLGGWLLTVMRRRCIDFLRRRRRRARKEMESGLSNLLCDMDPSQRMAEEELSLAIADAARQLPDPLKSVFILNALELRTFREISEESGIPMGTLMARKQKAVELIRMKLEKQGLFHDERRSKP